MADIKNIPLGQSQWRRLVGQDPSIQINNRFYEQNPANQVDQVSFLARPGLRPFQMVGTGPIRATYVQPGSFSDDLFVVSNDSLYSISNQTGLPTFIGNGIQVGTGKIAMAATGTVNGIPEYLFLADGRNLWIYVRQGYATGVFTGTVVNNDVIRLGLMYYKITTGAVDTGTPAGTVSNPWLVNFNGSSAAAMQNLFNAINTAGTPGVDYSSLTNKNPLAIATFSSNTQVTVQAVASSTAGNSVTTTTTAGSASWTNGGFLTGGGNPQWNTVETPDFVGISDVCYTSSYVIVVPAQGQGINGRFYWIRPGETTIDPLNFATAERAPDPIVQCVAVGDQFWLFGTSSTEVWYAAGSQTAPFQRIQGRLFDKGTWSGSAVHIKDSVIVVSRDGRVYNVTDSPNPISTPAIEEQIRIAIRAAESRFIN